MAFEAARSARPAARRGSPIPFTGLHLPSISLAFSNAAVVLAQLFVSAPFFIRAARGGFARVDREVEEAAAMDGATPGRPSASSRCRWRCPR
ncbi:MAG: hypothetical protein U0232_13420 [Thermomicrobiales bacterium]